MPPNPPSRTVRLIRPPTQDGVGAFSITVNGKSQFYAFHEIPCEIGGRGFEVHRLGLGNLYHVRIGEPQDCSCECLGFLVRDRCKHVLGMRKLIAEKLI